MAGLKMLRAATLLAVLIFSGGLFAQFSVTTGAQSFPVPGNFLDNWWFDADFGSTPVSVNISVTLTASTNMGADFDLTDVQSMSKATNETEWTNAHTGLLGITGPGTATNIAVYGSASAFNPHTVMLSGVCRFMFTVECRTSPTTVSNDITVAFSVSVGSNVTPSGLGIAGSTGLAYDNWQSSPPGATQPVGSSQAHQRHYANQVLGIHTHGSATDSVQYEVDALFPTPAATSDVSIRGLTATGVVGQVIVDVYDMALGGGSTLTATIAISDGAPAAAHWTTQAMSGIKKFRVVVRAGTGFGATPAYLINFFLTFGSNVTVQSPTASAVATTPPVQLITPSPAAGALAAGTQGTAYGPVNFSAQGGSGGATTYVWTISAGALPAGLSLTPVTASTNAQISGTPSASGSFSFTVRATNSGNTFEFNERAYTLTINPGTGAPNLTVSTNTVTVPTTVAGTAGTAGSFTVSGSNLTPASGNVTLVLTSTPAGIEMRNATASGTFATTNITIAYTGGAFAAQTIEVRFASTATAGSYTGNINISGGGATAQVVNLSGTVNAPGTPTLTVSTNTVTVPTTTAGTAGTAASFTVSGSNLTPASGNVTLVLTSTPAGIEMRNATAGGAFGTGNITIAYTGGAFAAQTIEVRFASTAAAGSFTGNINISGGGATAQVVNLSGTVNPTGGGTLTIITTTLPNGTVSTAYNATITAQNGTGPYTWSLSAGSLPPGLTLNTGSTTLTTSLSGTPTSAGTFNFTVRIQDSTAAFDTQVYNVTISTGGGTGPIGGGGGGGGCSADSTVSPWFLLLGVAGVLLVAARRRRTA